MCAILHISHTIIVKSILYCSHVWKIKCRHMQWKEVFQSIKDQAIVILMCR